MICSLLPRAPSLILVVILSAVSVLVLSQDYYLEFDDLPKWESPHAYAAICAIVRNEHGNLAEWVRYHNWIGIQKFYIFDHRSSPPLANELAPFMSSGLVEYHYFNNSWIHDAEFYKSPARQFLSPQGWAYDNCFRWYGFRHKFIGTFDVDEYVVLRGISHKQPNINSFLRLYEKYGGIMVHWQLFGPSGHLTRPTTSTLASYTQCVPRHMQQTMKEFQAIPLGFMKSFTNTKYYKAGCNPHQCTLSGAQYVNENFQPLSARVVKEIHWSKIVVHHYVTRSLEEYSLKMKRGSGHSQYSEANKKAGRTHRGWQYFAFMNASATAVCNEGQWLYQACCNDTAIALAAAAAAAAPSPQDVDE